MRSSSIHEIKQELVSLKAAELNALCLRLARFKKDNKELLTYLLFESHDVEAYTESVKQNMSEAFKEVNTTNLYFTKKNLRRILRQINKHIKYTGNKQTEAILLIHFCTLLKTSGIPFQKSTALKNIYLQQLKKVNIVIATLHEDLQYDLVKEIKALENDFQHL